MRSLFAVLSISIAVVGCSAVDDPPLGGPFGGTTGSTDPGGGNPGDPGNPDPGDPGNPNPGDDASVTPTQDSGTPTNDSGAPTKDSGTQAPDAGPPPQTAPTWTQIYTNYLKSGTKGRCSSCHSQGNSASSLYSWLQGRGYISGTSSSLVDAKQSCLSWYGGNMPTSGPSSYAQAVTDMNAWAAAGAQNN